MPPVEYEKALKEHHRHVKRQKAMGVPRAEMELPTIRVLPTIGVGKVIRQASLRWPV